MKNVTKNHRDNLNTTKNNQSDSAGRIPVCKSDQTLAERIKAAMAGEQTAPFARRCGFGESLLRKYLNGAMPRADYLFAIADASGVSLEWLATGSWPVYRSDLRRALDVATNIEPRISEPPDMQRLRLAIETVEEGLAAARATMETGKKADLVLAVYDLMDDAGANKERVLKLVKLAA